MQYSFLLFFFCFFISSIQSEGTNLIFVFFSLYLWLFVLLFSLSISTFGKLLYSQKLASLKGIMYGLVIYLQFNNKERKCITKTKTNISNK